MLANSTTAANALIWPAARVGGDRPTGTITTATLIDESNPGTPGQFELWLFAAPLSAVVNDAGTWTMVDADAANFIDIIPFGTTTFAAGTAALIYKPTLAAPIPYRITSGVNLVGQLVVRNGYTPANAGILRVDLGLQFD